MKNVIPFLNVITISIYYSIIYVYAMSMSQHKVVYAFCTLFVIMYLLVIAVTNKLVEVTTAFVIKLIPFFDFQIAMKRCNTGRVHFIFDVNEFPSRYSYRARPQICGILILHPLHQGYITLHFGCINFMTGGKGWYQMTSIKNS